MKCIDLHGWLEMPIWIAATLFYVRVINSIEHMSVEFEDRRLNTSLTAPARVEAAT